MRARRSCSGSGSVLLSLASIAKGSRGGRLSWRRWTRVELAASTRLRAPCQVPARRKPFCRSHQLVERAGSPAVQPWDSSRPGRRGRRGRLRAMQGVLAACLINRTSLAMCRPGLRCLECVVPVPAEPAVPVPCLCLGCTSAGSASRSSRSGGPPSRFGPALGALPRSPPTSGDACNGAGSLSVEVGPGGAGVMVAFADLHGGARRGDLSTRRKRKTLSSPRLPEPSPHNLSLPSPAPRTRLLFCSLALVIDVATAASVSPLQPCQSRRASRTAALDPKP